MTTPQPGEGSASASYRLEQYKRTPLSTSQGAQERRRQAALDERRRRRDASYSAARGLDAIGVGGLALPELSDEEEVGADEARSSAHKGKKSSKKKKKSKASKAADCAKSFANVLQQAELLDTLPEDLDHDWLALPWIPKGRRVLARVDWDPRYREDRLTLYSRRRGEPINPASSGQMRMPNTATDQAGDVSREEADQEEASESSMAQDAPSPPSTASADLGLPTSFASGPSTTTITSSSSSQAQQQQQQQHQQQKPRPRRRGGRSSHHHSFPSSYSFPLPLPLPRHTELDCVFSPRSAVLWALDVRRWGHASSSSTVTDLREHDAEFRLYWLSARLHEMEPPFVPAHFPANDVRSGGGEVAGATTMMLDATGPFPYPFIIKALPVVPAPIGRTMAEWKRKVLDVATAPHPPASCKTAKVRRLVTAPPATPSSGEGMDVDPFPSPAPAPAPSATLVTTDALLFPPPQQDTAGIASSSSDGILLLHREAGYVSGEEKTPLAAWVPTTCAAAEEGDGSGMDVRGFGRLLEEREVMRRATGGQGAARDDGGEMETTSVC